VALFRWEIATGIKAWSDAPFKTLFWLIGAFVASILITSVAAIPAASLGHDDSAGLAAISAMVEAVGRPATILTVGVSGPVVEECVYRICLIGKARAKVPLWGCVVLSSVIFATMHLRGTGWQDSVGVLPIFAQGLTYSVTYAATGNITVPLAMHILNNSAAIILYG
jgi:membrane protease YdiL (CAAX protease family)